MLRENINDLTAFLAVARERSFTRAAAQLGVAARNDVRSDARFRATSGANYLRRIQASGARSLRLSAHYVRRTQDRANLMQGS
jgi:hypothetical protein